MENQASSFYRFFHCPSSFPSPSANNFAFCTTFRVGWLSENITACTKAEGTAPLLCFEWVQTWFARSVKIAFSEKKWKPWVTEMDNACCPLTRKHTTGHCSFFCSCLRNRQNRHLVPSVFIFKNNCFFFHVSVPRRRVKIR